MAHLLRTPSGWLGLCVLALAGGGFTYWLNTSGAYPGMPEDRRAYLEWLATIHHDGDQAIEAGIDLLHAHPRMYPLYLRLAEVCREQEAEQDCRVAFHDLRPSGARTAAYRNAALALLNEGDQSRALWQEVAQSPALDPTLARRVIDQVLQSKQDDAFDMVAAAWRERLASDSADVGAAFGLGYAASLRHDAETARRLLAHAREASPGDPQIYRELGRLYLRSGELGALERTLRAGIAAAEDRYDVEQALVLRGNLGLSLMEQAGRLEEAQALFEEALEQSRLLADRETEGYNLYRLALVRLKRHRYDTALALLDSAEVRYEEARHQLRVRTLRGTALTALFRFNDARRVLEDVVDMAIAQRDPGTQVRASLALAQLYFRMGSYSAARDIGLEVLEDSRRYGLTDIEVAARIVLGDVDRRLGNVEQAETHYKRGLEQVGEGSARQAELYLRLGRTALNMQNASAAEAYYAELLGQAQESAATRARLQEQMGQAYGQFGNYEQAERYLDEAIAAYREVGDTQRLALALLMKVWGLIEQSDYGQAEGSLKEATALLRSRNAPPAHASYAEVAWGNLHLARGRYREALHHLRRAQKVEDQSGRPLVQWHVLHATALAHWGLGDTAEAEQYFREAVETIEAMRDNLDLHEHRAAFVQDKVGVYKNFSAFLEAQGRSAEAFHYAERARSRSLADLLLTTQQSRISRSENLRDETIEALQRTRALMAAMSAPDDDLEATDERTGLMRASNLRREYLRADSAYQERVQRLPENSMFKPLLLAQPLAAREAQAVLKEGEAMVAYELRQRSILSSSLTALSASTAHVITKDTVISRTLTVEEESLAERIRFLRNRISDAGTGPGTGWEEPSRQLYQDLIAPVLEALPASIEHLHLVPEGVLHYLPFAALQDEGDDFLVERYSLSVTPSASVLEISRSRNPGLWRTILAVADPEGALPGSREEARAVASIPSVRPHVLIGPEATQEALEKWAGWADIIHIATHGRFVSQAPWSSHLELHGDVLSVAEIGSLQLDAYLVTLSACETALSGGFTSDIPPGDEWVGLNQAFLAAGTPTVMASLWPIDDKVSSSFMINFYEKLLDAQGKSKALSRVQREALRSAETSHPFYWAAFTVIGDPL